MYKIIDIKQNSPEWHKYRRSHIGASDAPIIIGSSPYKSGNDLWREKMGYVEPPKMTDRMKRGHDLEPEARKIAEEHFEMSFEPKVFESLQNNFLSASVDGATKCNTGLLEIKCPGEENHNWALKGNVMDYYQHQIQHQLMITGAKRCIYMSYRPESNDPVKFIFISPDENLWSMMMAKYMIFWNHILMGKEFEPPMKFDRY